MVVAHLQSASLDHVFVWRADAPAIEAEGARIIAPEVRPKYQGLDCPASQTCYWSPSSFAELKRLIDSVPNSVVREPALGRIARLNPALQLDWRPEQWTNLGGSAPPQDYDKILAENLRRTGCDANGAPYVIHGLVHTLNRRFKARSQAADLAAIFLDIANCPGARGLSEQDKLDLQEIRAGAFALIVEGGRACSGARGPGLCSCPIVPPEMLRSAGLSNRVKRGTYPLGGG